MIQSLFPLKQIIPKLNEKNSIHVFIEKSPTITNSTLILLKSQSTSKYHTNDDDDYDDDDDDDGNNDAESKINLAVKIAHNFQSKAKIWVMHKITRTKYAK